MLFARSSRGIERLEISDSDTDKNPRIVTLENCIKVDSESQSAFHINVITKTGQIQFQCTSESELDLWTRNLQSVAFNDKISSSNSIVEYNELYCSSIYEGKFKVTLATTDATIKNNLDPKSYILQLTSTEMQLRSYEEDGLVFAKWPYRYIRKYGYKDRKFTFEAGRKCTTGEGVFKIDYEEPREIFKCMAAKMKSMKELLNGDNSGNMEENQLNAALSMEAGSRSPLPPSINSPSSPTGDFSMTSQVSIKGFNSTDNSVFSILLGPTSAPPTPPAKNVPPIPIPNKPPRKVTHERNSDSPPTPPERNKSIAVNDYEKIENITEAWKTMGISDVKHDERLATPEDELKDFVMQRSKSFNRNETRKVSIVDINENNTSVSNIDSPKDVDNNYDRLNFFPTSNSGNKVTSSGYTTVVPIIPPPAKRKAPVTDDYEIFENVKASTSSQQEPELSASRLADDSYLGYGVIRKTSLPHSSSTSTNSSTIVSFSSTSTSQTVVLSDNDFFDQDHRQIPLDYAIVSKPKRV